MSKQAMELIAAIEQLLPNTTPVEKMPEGYDEDRYYSDEELLRLKEDKRLRELVPELIAATKDIAKDAARYRWLREQDWFASELCVVRNPKKMVMPGADCPSRMRLDEAIDAAAPCTDKGNDQ